MHFQPRAEWTSTGAGVPLMEIGPTGDYLAGGGFGVSGVAQGHPPVRRRERLQPGGGQSAVRRELQRAGPRARRRWGPQDGTQEPEHLQRVFNAPCVTRRARQIDAVSSAVSSTRKTRRWDPDAGVTAGMRSKEDAHDYRYFPSRPDARGAGARAWWSSGSASCRSCRGSARLRFGREYGLPD